MDVRLSPEQLALRATAAQVVDRLGPRSVGQLEDVQRADKLEAAVDSSGWRVLRAPEPNGAPLASAVEVAIVAEELGRRLADVSLLGPTLAAELRRLAEAPTSQSPETVALTPALSELACVPHGVSPDDVVAIDAQGAGSALVVVPTSHGFQLGAVALQPEDQQVDLTRPCAVPAEATAALPLDDPHLVLTDDDMARWTALGLALTSVDLVGVMRGALQLTCEYAAERRQYGTAIGSFQAVQHLLADAMVAMEGSASAALYAAWAVDALPAAEAVAAGAVAKAYSSRSARTVCETAIQVHGGIGNTWECLAHVFLRRALLSGDILGGAGVNLARVLAHQGIGGSDGLR